MRFPSLMARNLEGAKVRIPEDLSGTANLVVLAFQREHQYVIETWLPHFAGLVEANLGLEVWEVPALPRSYRIWRRAIDAGMRAGIPDSDARRHTLTTYLDLQELQRALDLRDKDDIHLYLLDAGGDVRWHGSGAYNESTLGALNAVLREITAPT